MKTCKHLFERVCSFDNLWQAFHQARKGKRARGEVAAFEYALERNLWQPCWSASCPAQTIADSRYFIDIQSRSTMSTFEQQLMERLEDYALRIIKLYSALPDYPAAGHHVQVIGKQPLRSGTSAGANDAEAIRNHSLADKAARQQICIKEIENYRSSHRG